jgi:hypothetical protein
MVREITRIDKMVVLSLDHHHRAGCATRDAPAAAKTLVLTWFATAKQAGSGKETTKAVGMVILSSYV